MQFLPQKTDKYRETDGRTAAALRRRGKVTGIRCKMKFVPDRDAKSIERFVYLSPCTLNLSRKRPKAKFNRA